MNIEINIDRHPVAARGVVARQITYKEMWEKVSARVDVLTQELAAANEHVKALQQRNAALWDNYHDLRSLLNTQNCTEATQKPTDGVVASTTATYTAKSSLPPSESFCGHCGDCANPTDESIDELLKRLDKIAGHYGRPYGLPMAHKGTKQLLFDAVRNWVSGK